MNEREELAALRRLAELEAKAGGSAAAPARDPGMLESAVVGAARGVKDAIDTGAGWLASGFDKLAGTNEGERVRRMNDAGKADFERDYGNSTTASVARVGGNIVATLPVGGVVAAPVRALGATRLGNAIATGGMRTGAPAATTLTGKAADLGIRSAGAGATGYAGAELIDPGSGEAGAVVSAALPGVTKLAGKAGDAVATVVRPFFGKGQDRIVADTLRRFSFNPAEAEANLRNVPSMIPGSVPTTVAAAGDEGLAGLSRTLQSADPRYAAELAARSSAQNAARTAALEEVAGNTGKLDLARRARDEATGAMRETVLDAAGRLPAASVLGSLDRLIAKPDNAGKIAQSALNEVRNRIAQFAPDGQIDARALYAIRKDINDTLSGKLQGEAGNLKLASGQLVEVKKLIDDAIDLASRRVPQSSSRAVMPAGANIERAGLQGPYGSMSPRPTWRGYLDRYTQESIPINQMEALDDVLRGISTGSVDKAGNAILSGAKLNNLLRNQAKDLGKVLAPEQLNLLRRLSADLNASQLAANSGRAVGSNTVQNLSGVSALSRLLGERLGTSAPVQATLGRTVNWVYKKPDEQILEKLGQALLEPQFAARLMQPAPTSPLAAALNREAARLGYRSAPALSAQE